MNPDTREHPTNSTYLNRSRKPFSTVQSPRSHGSRETLGGNLPSGMIPPSRLYSPSPERDRPGTTKPARLEVKPREKAEDRRVDSQKVQRMLKFRTSILALDPHAKFLADGHHLTVIHSKCGGKSTQKAANDTSNFREHISVCQGPRSSTGDNSVLKSSIRGGPAPSFHPTASTPTRPAQLPCPGFSLVELFGKDFKSLLDHEREQVTRAAEVAGLVWLGPREKSSIISMSCLKESPSLQEPVKACRNCSKVLDLSGFKDVLRRETYKFNNKRFTPFRPLTIDDRGSWGQSNNGVWDP